MRCIYCLCDRAVGEFDHTEHVVPRSMGTFEGNLTLNDEVCDGCNQHFGDTIDLMLGRGSAEAVRRVDYGVQPAEKTDRLLRDRVRFKLDSDDEWNGLLLERVAEEGTSAVRPLPQVGFRRSASERFTFVQEADLAREDRPLPGAPYPEAGILVVADSEGTKSRLIALLHSRGIAYVPSHRTAAPAKPGETLPVEIIARCDRLVLRCVAKIALNYLAYCEGRDLVLEDSFGAIRRFIRLGEEARYPLVLVDDAPILSDDLPHSRQTNGHLVTVGWASDGASLVGQVSLFNHARYRISLARNYGGLWRPIRYGHHFNIETRKVERLVGTDLVIS